MKKLVVTLPYQYNVEEEQALKERLISCFGDREIEYHVDEEIIGGIIVFDGETVYDGTIRSKLRRVEALIKR